MTQRMLDVMSIPNWITLFTRVNQDCRITGESVVSLCDVDYYSYQIYNLAECTWSEAVGVARRMREYVECTGLHER